MPGMGPPPKPDDQRRRRNATVAMVRLPAEGRKKRAPNWPLIPDVVLTARRDLAETKVEQLEYDLEELRQTGKPCGTAEAKLDRAREAALICNRQLAEQRKLEAALWKDLWSLPQAVEWERLGWFRDVAVYVRHHVLGQLGDLDNAREARQWSDRLGLTPLAMLRLRWEVVRDEVSAKRDTRPVEAPKTARARLRVVDPGAVAG